jgi:hypothetical protein
LTTGRNTDAGLIFSGIPAFTFGIFQHPIEKITPSAAVYGRAGCLISIICSLDVQFFSTDSIMDARVYPFLPPAF